jgi:hypothetical protein
MRALFPVSQGVSLVDDGPVGWLGSPGDAEVRAGAVFACERDLGVGGEGAGGLAGLVKVFLCEGEVAVGGCGDGVGWVDSPWDCVFLSKLSAVCHQRFTTEREAA